ARWLPDGESGRWQGSGVPLPAGPAAFGGFGSLVLLDQFGEFFFPGAVPPFLVRLLVSLHRRLVWGRFLLLAAPVVRQAPGTVRLLGSLDRRLVEGLFLPPLRTVPGPDGHLLVSLPSAGDSLPHGRLAHRRGGASNGPGDLGALGALVLRQVLIDL